MVNCKVIDDSKVFVYKPKKQKTAQKFKYTQDGLNRLALLIQASLSYRDWSIRRLAREAKEKGHNIVASTILRYINAETSPPDEKVEAIAPFIYKAVRFTGNGVEVDPTQTYENWEELAIIGTNENNIYTDYTEAGDKAMSQQYNSLPEMIKNAMEIYGITQSELESALAVMQNNKTTEMNLIRLREVQSGTGTDPTREERRTLYMLLDTEGKAFSDDEWFGDIPMRNPAIMPLQENNNHSNYC